MPSHLDRPSSGWQPVQSAERYSSLDLLRGFALFGVLIINLLFFFRVSLWDHILHFHSHPGSLNHAIDILAAAAIEFKAFDLFALAFGIGMAIQADRAKSRGASAELFLIRRFLALLLFGACHMVLISNVDILMLYSVCGLLLILFLRLPTWLLALAGIGAIYLPSPLPLGPMSPGGSALHLWASTATRIYSHGSFREIVAFRWQETNELIRPILEGSAQHVSGLMLLGVAAWRSGLIREPRRYRLQLWLLCAIAGITGIFNTTADLMPKITGAHIRLPFALEILGSDVPLALAYASVIIISGLSPKSSLRAAPFAAAGQMAFTNYLTQSLVFGLVFYGYGAGLFGRFSPAPVALFGTIFYVAQLALSQWWLARCRFGPFEWLWRTLTYGRRQPMLRT